MNTKKSKRKRKKDAKSPKQQKRQQRGQSSFPRSPQSSEQAEEEDNQDMSSVISSMLSSPINTSDCKLHEHDEAEMANCNQDLSSIGRLPCPLNTTLDTHDKMTTDADGDTSECEKNNAGFKKANSQDTIDTSTLPDLGNHNLYLTSII